MKYLLAIVTLSALIFSCKRQDIISNSITPSIDKRVELMSILARIADYEEYNDSTYISYVDNIEEHFSKYANSKAVLTLKRLRNHTNLAYDGIMNMAVNINIEGDKIIPVNDINKIDDRWPSDITKRFYTELNEFYIDSEFEEWFKRNEYIYKDVLSTSEIVSEINQEWFTRFFGYKNEAEFKLILAPGNGYGNYGPSTKSNTTNVIYSIIGIGNVDENNNPILYSDEFIPTVVHEFLHSYINPLTEKNIENFNESGNKIYTDTQTLMNRLAYGDGKTVVNESLVRACVIEYLKDNNYPWDEVIFEEVYNKRIGFYWMSGLTKEISDYKLKRNEYKEFSDYVPQLQIFFRNAAENIELSKMLFEENKAKVVKTYPANGEMVSAEVVKSISLTFDKPLLKDFYSFGRGKNQSESYPKYTDDDDNFVYSNENRTLTIKNVTVKPNESYRMKVNGRMTITQDANISNDYELVFQTE